MELKKKKRNIKGYRELKKKKPKRKKLVLLGILMLIKPSIYL